MKRALIIGSGIAGPVAAIALRQAGLETFVYEARSSDCSDLGSYLTVASNGLRALAALDIDKPVKSAGFPTSKIVMLNEVGRRIGTLPAGTAMPDGPVSITIKRAHLHRALLEQAMQNAIPFEFGKRLEAAEIRPDGGVIAHFDDGTRAAGDLLIGCDGVHSATRRIIDPSAPAARYVGLVNFGGYTADLPVTDQPGVWHMVFGRRAFFGYIVDPTGGIVWFVNMPHAEVSASERASTSAEEWKRQLINLFDDYDLVAKIIAAGDVELAADNTFDLPTVPTWHRGPMLIIGDAAHAPSPSSGQGASMAIEDAAVLAKCLRDSRSSSDALVSYEGLRRRRVERIVAAGARASQSKTLGPIQRKLRDLLLPYAFKFFANDKSLAWMYDYDVAGQKNSREAR